MSEPVTNQQLQTQGNGGPPARREIRVVESQIALIDTAKFEQMQRVAEAMASATIIPDHLVAQPYWWKKNMAPAEYEARRKELGPEEWARSWAEARRRTVANCFLVVEQAFRWGMSPFAVAPETYVVGGKLAFQGKLVLAVVNVLAGLSKRLAFSWSGDGPDRAITISGQFADEDEPRVDTIVWKSVKTENAMWKADPDQKLLYTGVLHWSRRHCPEVVLGVKSLEDLEAELEAERRGSGGTLVSDILTPAAPQQALSAPAEPFEVGPPAASNPVIEATAKPAATSVADLLGKPSTNGHGAPAPVGAKDAEAAPENPTEPLGNCITPEQVKTLRALCADQGVSFEKLEEAFDGPIGEYSEPDRTGGQIYAMAEKWVLDTAAANKAEAEALEKKNQPAGNGDLFSGGTEAKSKPPRGIKGE